MMRVRKYTLDNHGSAGVEPTILKFRKPPQVSTEYLPRVLKCNEFPPPWLMGFHFCTKQILNVLCIAGEIISIMMNNLVVISFPTHISKWGSGHLLRTHAV